MLFRSMPKKTAKPTRKAAGGKKASTKSVSGASDDIGAATLPYDYSQPWKNHMASINRKQTSTKLTRNSTDSNTLLATPVTDTSTIGSPPNALAYFEQLVKTAFEGYRTEYYAHEAASGTANSPSELAQSLLQSSMHTNEGETVSEAVNISDDSESDEASGDNLDEHNEEDSEHVHVDDNDGIDSV